MISRSRWGWQVLAALGVLTLAVAAGAPGAAAQPPVTTDPEAQFTGVRRTLFSGLANQIGSLPNPTGGGFTFIFDPALGVFTQSSESFGPVFANRAETTGRGKLTLNTSFSRHTFDEVDGVNLRNGELTAILQRPIIPGVDLFDLVSIRESVSADVFTLGALYGATDRLDVGLTIPILNVKVKERVAEQALLACVGTVCGDPGFIPSTFQTSEAESTGLGDIVLRGKYNFLQVPQVLGGRFGMSFALDVKLPTGDRGERQKFIDPLQGVNLLAEPSTQRFQIGDPPLGTGIVRVRPQIVTSGSWFGLAPHVNVGMELGKTQGITNDLVYEVGADYTLFKRVTVSADLLGRHAFDVDRTRITRQGILAKDFGKTANPDTLAASFGLKANPFGALLVFLNFLVPLNETGIRDDLTPTFGVEWSY